MNTQHLATLAAALTELKATRDRIDAVADELQQLYDDQPGAWRWTPEGDAASSELTGLEDAVGGLDDAIKVLTDYAFTFSDAPNFLTLMNEHYDYAPLPDQLPTRDEIVRAHPGKPGAAPYPFIKRIDPDDDADGSGLEPA